MTMIVRSGFLSAVLACTLTQPALAQSGETVKWGQVGGWQIRVDRTVGDGCFASQRYEDGTALRVGYDAQKKTIYFMMGNSAWRSLEAGKVYQMLFVFDDYKKYNGELTGTRLGDATFLEHSNVTYEFTKDFMERGGVRVHYRGAQIAHLSLRNTFAALAEVVNCQKEIAGTGDQGNSTQPTSDPFSRGSRPGRSSDPFSR